MAIGPRKVAPGVRRTEDRSAMKPRSALSAAEIEALYAAIDAKLDRVGIETQPEVAAKILKLVADPRSGLRQYAEVIKPDQALNGRLLRLANSAYFAQRKAVTSLDRACVLLGIDRLKAVALGFYLSRSAATDPQQKLSRRVWGESVFRACLAVELARRTTPSHAPEAFVVGLMLDAGLPLLRTLLGKPVDAILAEVRPPAPQFEREMQSLPFTHVDIAATLMRRWRLPELLARPIERHHTPAPEEGEGDAIVALHRIAYYAGSVHLDPGTALPRSATPLAGIAERTCGVKPDVLAPIVRRACEEYRAMTDLFRGVADSIGDIGQIADQVSLQLASIIDGALLGSIRKDEEGRRAISLGTQDVEFEPDRDGRMVAYLRDSTGERLISYIFTPGASSVESLLDALGIDEAPAESRSAINNYLRSLAA